MQISRSNKLRADGNKIYEALHDDGLARVLMDDRLAKAKALYESALSAATIPQEAAAAAKNLAVLTKRALWLKRQRDEMTGPAALELQVEALSYYVRALSNAAKPGCQLASTWQDEVLSAALELVEQALDWKECDMVKDRRRLATGWPNQDAVLRKLLAALPLGSSDLESGRHVAALKARVAMAYGKCLYGEAVGIQEAGSTEQAWRRGLDLVAQVQPLFATVQRCAKLAGEQDAQEEAESLLEGTYICDAICRSTQARHNGDAMLAKLLAKSSKQPPPAAAAAAAAGRRADTSGVADKSSSSSSASVVDVEYAQLVADKYREALDHARGQDPESEARAHLALGQLYTGVLGAAPAEQEQGERAKASQARGIEHFKAVMHLGVEMQPRVVSNTDWYLAARAALLRMQQGVGAAEEEAERADKADVLKQLEPELTELRTAASKGAHVLLQHVYDKHPPPGLTKNFELTKAMLSGDRIKETLRTAVIAYHPDKQVACRRRWQVLAGEISKELSSRYQSFK